VTVRGRLIVFWLVWGAIFGSVVWVGARGVLRAVRESTRVDMETRARCERRVCPPGSGAPRLVDGHLCICVQEPRP